ncbi:hypothetical protein L1987_60636 [Smallanthus sonchifolius]|uniref:Uncharacterized protein n=1 Tax=Smallanthus sonchifolius TaxID=185202 RepID=A0ACB9D8Q6_9ASTR|nr:hypothetical protein L1987_60636 [Smallanthus sonchifolius]
MKPSLASILVLASKLKEDILSKTKSEHLQSFVSPSAYDTAWLAMIPHPLEHDTPLFKGCLEWLVDNQKEEGYWGEFVYGDFPTIDALPATLACMVVLQKWGLGAQNIEKGLKFIHANMVDMLHDQHDHLPRWFTIVFPATVELAESSGLKHKFCDHMKSMMSDISDQRRQVLVIEDGSLFQSPSATAQAYISTQNHKCLKYLTSLVEKYPNGVPQKYPVDEELVELSMVDQVQKLGLYEYFAEEIDNILRKIYSAIQRYSGGVLLTICLNLSMFY